MQFSFSDLKSLSAYKAPGKQEILSKWSCDHWQGLSIFVFWRTILLRGLSYWHPWNLKQGLGRSGCSFYVIPGILCRGTLRAFMNYKVKNWQTSRKG